MSRSDFHFIFSNIHATCQPGTFAHHSRISTPLFELQTTVGFIAEDGNSTFRYIMNATQRSVETIFARRFDLPQSPWPNIAASIASAVLRCHRNWLKGQWDSSNFNLAAETLDGLYLSRSLPAADGLKDSSTMSSSDKREVLLFTISRIKPRGALARPASGYITLKGRESR
ncbi:hypothetical protein N7449_006314 [Penicillium cf. viridicatum]|uniref:Uncharacterized protein n=1 Tax=Penicillium cf. viridicatum TaxID=2972119 RepID=A0A9W9MB04_9EURO|nr:hypothetical protein N7449_006314 [Penicillium cf. viridicatum]